MEKKTIGSFLAALRKANGLTQKQLAEKLNVSDKAVSRWERDECAPDLSLIPVLAEIYGVTSDEILRGQRHDPEASVRESDNNRSEKQLKRLLERTQTKFRIRSIITFAIALAGIIVAAICNHGLNQAAIGFMVGSVFFLAAAVCQIIFLILGFSAVNAEELDADSVKRSKRSMALITELTVSAIIILFIGSCPLVTITGGTPYFGLDAGYVFEEGIASTLLSAFICLVISYVINMKAGYAKAPNLSAPSRRLLLRCVGILLIVLVLIYAAQFCLNVFFLDYYHLYAPCQRFDTLEEFKEYMETPTDPDGNPMTLVDTSYEANEYGFAITYYHYVATNGEEYTLSDYNTDYLLPLYTEDGISYNVIPLPGADSDSGQYHYLRFNLSVEHVEISNESEIVPIYTFTYDQIALANDIALCVNIIFFMLDICAIVTTTVIYIKKRKKLQ